MSHSVFKDFDEDKNSSNCNSRSDAADNHLVVFIDKDGDVQVDPNGLQNLIGKFNRAPNKAKVMWILTEKKFPSICLQSMQTQKRNRR